jgi:uncharacterized membrane-anchored protein
MRQFFTLALIAGALMVTSPGSGQHGGLQLTTVASAQEPRPTQWLDGPATASLGDDVAEVRLPAGYGFLAAQDARRVLEEMGNPTNGSEVGLIVPQRDEDSWFALFEYRDVGYVSDSERDRIDAAALLESLRKGTEAANVGRKKRGIPGLHVVSWIEQPNYDVRTHNLQWAMLAKDDNSQEVANYNVRLLGRNGYMSVTLVDEPRKLALAKTEFERLLAGFSYRPGKTYAEYVRGDRVAEIGLAALVAGGAGAAVVKYGLLGKLGALLAPLGKALIVAVLSVFAFLGRLIRGLFGSRNRTAASPVDGPTGTE